MKINKKFIFDFIINIVTSMVPMAVLQLIVLPYLGKVIEPDKYGTILTLTSIVYIIPQTLGNSLNNTRLIHQNEYAKQEPYSDYQLLFGITNALSLVSCIACYFIVGAELTALDVIFFAIFGLLWASNEYLTVIFRLDLDYISYLINNVILSAGYLLGLLLFQWLHYWQLIYIVGLLFCVIFIALRKRKFVFERGKISPLLKKTVCTQGFLVIAGGVNSVYNYLDRLLILPILGGLAVSVYYSATVFTKLISLLLGPLSTVILSYLSRNDKADVKKFNFALLVGIGVAIVGYVICIFIGKYILLLLYPQYKDAALEYIYVTSAVSMLGIIFSLLNPFVLKYCQRVYQIVINVVGLAVYIGVALLLINQMGIWGVCIASAVSMPIKVILQLLIFYISIFKKKKIIPEEEKSDLKEEKVDTEEVKIDSEEEQ